MPVKTSKDFILDLKNPDDAVRRYAAEKLGEAREVLAVQPLCDALRDPAKSVRWTAASALGEIGVKNQTVIDALIATLDDPEPYVRQYAAGSLDELGDPLAVGPILRTMDKFNQPEIAGVIHHLTLDQAAITPLVKALENAIDEWRHTEREVNDDDALAHMYDPRKSVIAAFRHIQDPAVTPALTMMCRRTTDIPHFVKAAHLALESIGAPALPYLLSQLKDPDPWGRDEIFRLLGLLGDVRGLDALIAEVGTPKAAILLRPTLDNWMIRDDEPGTRSLKKMGWPAAQKFLELLKSTDVNVRGAAVKIIAHARDRHATPYLLETLLAEWDKGIQEHIIWGFQALADPATIFVLIAELEGQHYHPAQMALIAIGQQAREVLIAAKSQVRPEARERIDWVLEQFA